MTKILIDKETVEFVIEAIKALQLSVDDYYESSEEASEQGDKAIPTLRQALEQSTDQEKGCAYCTNALYAGTKCKNCGRVTEQSTEQEPVAMKFKIYKPTVPDPTRQGINNALLPWIYDQDRSSGFDASMWVTPVATLPPQPQEAAPRKPLTDEMVTLGAKALAKRHADSCGLEFDDVWKYYADEHKDDARAALTAAHGIGEKE